MVALYLILIGFGVFLIFAFGWSLLDMPEPAIKGKQEQQNNLALTKDKSSPLILSAKELPLALKNRNPKIQKKV